ncbi:putative alpha/beta hydrolase [Lacibacter cauensis]|uniref:Putative alpha/beta hydrolase n=1 Tax=Lacibacter cauensis TaxID=510947 RepID=A0A562SWS0_9BACT|nr:alpha/beta fold hydrolase [Lacibacter cauensis]TWI85747.1 putative alpha/beta hydrolase [Lacibacter cauensis]
MFTHIEINNAANQPIVINVYEAEHSNDILIIASATGMKQTFYKKFAAYLASEGITVMTFDYTGIGQSLKNDISKYKHTATDWGEKDLQAVIQYAATGSPSARIILAGHSIGGQLIGLAPSSQIAQKIILIAAQSGYWKFWKGKARIKMFLTWYVLFPSLTRLFGYMPAKKISNMENLPGNVARQWSKWCRNQEYLFADILQDKQYFNTISCPLTAFSIEGDSYAPKESVEWFTHRYQNAEKKVIHLHPTAFNTNRIGHFSVFHERFESNIWKLLLNEIKDN